MVVVFLFSVVWHWNDFFEPFIYLNRMEHFTLPMRLSVLSPSLDQVTGGQAGDLSNEALVMAAVFLVILPPWPSTCSPSASSWSPSTAPAWSSRGSQTGPGHHALRRTTPGPGTPPGAPAVRKAAPAPAPATRARRRAPGRDGEGARRVRGHARHALGEAGGAGEGAPLERPLAGPGRGDRDRTSATVSATTHRPSATTTMRGTGGRGGAGPAAGPPGG